jgi:hypothetical protein
MPRVRREIREARPAIERHVKTFFEGHQITERRWPSGPSQSRVPGLLVYEAGPGPKFGGWSYLTSGVWDATAHDGHGLEFVLSANERSMRHVEILTILAYYHAGPENQRVNIWHTLDIGEPWTRGSQCTHLLISLPYAYGPALEICEWSGGHARILAAQPITAAERAYKVEHGADALEQRLEDAKAAFYDPQRPSVV